MRDFYCTGCGRMTGHKKRFTALTAVDVGLSLGVWLMAMPFYPDRCVACGLAAPRTLGQLLKTVLWVALSFCLLAGLLGRRG